MKDKNNSKPLQGRLPHDKMVRIAGGMMKPIKPQSPREIKQQSDKK
ncbi:MAG: hypothetical protein SFW35_08545 [Chitinophagales bacterium]|nr:hypothetical protein [Chitinophagales bacterium]